MLDQIFDVFRKSAEASMQMQQDLFRQWTQPWMSGAPAGGGVMPEWGRVFNRQWIDLMLEALNKNRESVDAAYRAGIQIIEQALRASDARSTDDYRRVVEDLWRKLFEAFKTQSETQFREFQSLAERSFEMARRAEA